MVMSNGNMNINPHGNAYSQNMNNMGNMNQPQYMFNNQMNYNMINPAQPIYNYNSNQINPINMMYNPYQINNISSSNYNRNLSSNFNYNNSPMNIPLNQYNMNLNNMINMNSNNKPTNISKKSLSSKHLRPIDEENFNNSNMNNKSNSYYNEKVTPDTSSYQNRGNLNEGGYQPYSLKEYKDLTSAKIVLGGLGPNIGSKEWEEKQEKKKKVHDYGQNVNTTNKQVIKIKRNTARYS